MPNICTSVLRQRVFWLCWQKLWVLLCASAGGWRCLWGAPADGRVWATWAAKSSDTSTKNPGAHNPTHPRCSSSVKPVEQAANVL